MKTIITMIVVASTVFAQGAPDSRKSPPKTDPTPKAASIFVPSEGGAIDASSLTLVKGKLFVDWVDHEKPKVVAQKPDTATMNTHATQAMNARMAGTAFEQNTAIRSSVETGLKTPDGIAVLPLGRFEWTKPPLFVKKGDSAQVAVIGVLVCATTDAGSLPKGFRVKGEFVDTKGTTKLADFSATTLPGTPKNGVFLATIPAGAALKGSPECQGFSFRIIEAKALK